MINFLAENWVLLVVLVCAVCVVIYSLLHFFSLPTKTQIQKVKEWLLYAVSLAEKELGGGTGQLKLRYVYDLFLTRFPSLSKVIAFEMFSGLVDEVLVEFRHILSTNNNVKTLIEDKKE